ncbi:hypothetical protein CcaverHIS002_0307120 [Cutaneotrichosporon cavernicola]|uniref:N-acetyltransferase domain-containing protein n=1 Tax=Cutaneotrichosporon cavernicola TaxID=279322 RepID=A0AA48IJ16_9TREE|nr:uncharacterized protein CcaverHIS019_0307030 [Cutaneotrichosporon cavernicola]BEI82844.1 hypothetical protein CcaverHIS002_0307120 [Cutaneotrichosporon cavernicola]BEI90633.1 hypothetical protein CcaverHIS019_0307030 [Cutaneotrichosporon cavernicola]BEI98411.1 hypothetical protein CcaverHIS631_0307100 [Cutaneotrichosporon cavernicola]BEJ06184.1 hypothetical protein CcaverHIS641_0307060 [Cutaneotrichosporon cavernicola]
MSTDRSPAYASSLKWDAVRGEPYLQLPSFPDLRLIPYREGIASDLVTLFNHPPVGCRLFALPYPMSRVFADQLELDILAKQAPILEKLSNSKKTEGIGAVWPFKALWSESQSRVVGDIFIWPNTVEPMWDDARQGRYQAGQATEKGSITEESVVSLPPAEQSWMIGYVLEPELYGQGIMSETLACILQGWVKPIMGVGEVAAIIAVDNLGSKAVAEKNGFTYRREEVTQWPEDKGGGVKVHGYYTWQSST